VQRRFFILTTIVVCTFATATSYAQATDDSINSELNAAEGMSGGDATTLPSKPVVQGDLIPEDQGPRLNESRPAGPPPTGTEPEPPPKIITKKAAAPPPPQSAPPAPAPKVETPAEAVPPPPEEEAPAAAAEAPAPEATQDYSADENIPAPPALEDSNVSANEGKHVQAFVDHSKPCACDVKPGVPYRDRRSKISGFFGFEGGTYAPVNYMPQINTGQTYGSYYSGGAAPNVELVFGAKFNFFLGSIGAQVGGGFFSATASSGAVLTVNPITAGLIYSMDSLFKEPYVVPYVVAGAYTDIYKEVDQGLSIDGQTSYAPFYSVGLMFQLDWIDPETHDSGYKDFGLENTFIFLEMRSFLASNDFNADFSTPLQFSGGFRFEF
jgi:hypothetical protein